MEKSTSLPRAQTPSFMPWSILNYVIGAVSRRFGDKAKEVERFLKFAFVGVIGAVVDFGTLLVLQSTALRPTSPHKDEKVIAATTIAFLAAVTSNFIWNRFWTYPDSRSRSIRRQMAQFTFINAIGWCMRTVWIRYTYLAIGAFSLPFFVDTVNTFSSGYVPGTEATEKLGTFLSQLIAIGFVMIWNFFANRYWTYNDVD